MINFIFFSSMNKLLIFYKLAYWKHLLVVHLLDHIHIVKNFASYLYQYTTSKESGSVIVRHDLQEITQNMPYG